MFRRRTDFSWPLMLVLIGFFYLSLRLPRPWEEIARPTRLTLRPPKSLHIKELALTAKSRDIGSPLDAFRSIKPAGYVANNSSGFASKEPRTSDVSVVAAKLPISGVATAATVVEEPVVAVAAEGSKDSAVVQTASPTMNAAAQPILPPLPIEDKEAATAAESDVESRVLRVAPEPPPGPGLASTDATPTERSMRASPVVAVQRLPAVAEEAPNPQRPVIPEPQVPVEATTQTTNPKPILPQPNTIANGGGASPADSAGPREKGDRAVPQISEASAARLPMRAIGRAWEEPAQLQIQLEELRKHASTQAWANKASMDVRRLGPAISVGAAETTEILQRLEQLTAESPSLVAKVDDETLAQNLTRTSRALERRVLVWKQIGRMGGMAAADAPAPAVDPRSFNKCLNEIDQLTSDSSEGHAWRKYLLIESLRDWSARRRNSDERLPRELAQQVLKRLNQMSVTSNQRQFLTSGPMADLHQEMLRHTAEPVASNRLLEHLENYEKSGLPSDARLLARDCQFLAVGSGLAQRELGERVETYYRNANLRIAVTAELLNRMVPKQEPEYAPVNDTIQNVPVRGQSLMASEIAVRMIPDPHRVRLALEVNGEVAALTRSDAGPATFFSDSESSYIARKPLEISLRGIRMWPTEVAVDNSSQLRGISTGFDGVPLFDRIARNVARSQHDQKMPAAEAEVREKIAAKAKDRVDRETTAQVTTAAKRLHDELLGPMDSLLLDPVMIAAETTEKRFNMRIRLAGSDQLGGHTPRPQAPSDSLASIQLHESMLNNVLERLELDGQTFDLAGLGQRLAERLHRFQPKPVDPDQQDVKISFAAKDAVHVRCNDGRMEITLAVARLSKGVRKWKDFQVRAFYRPVVQGRNVDLAREGIVQLIGPKMNAGAQIALRGVFSKVFSQKESIHLTPESFVKNPKLDGVIVTQFVINDGWIGAAIGPQGTANAQAATTRR